MSKFNYSVCKTCGVRIYQYESDTLDRRWYDGFGNMRDCYDWKVNHSHIPASKEYLFDQLYLTLKK